MVFTNKYPITLDGVRLDTLAYNISTKEGRDISAGVVGDDIETGMRDGNIWVPDKKQSAGRVVLKMWVSGADVDGVTPVDDYEKYNENLDLLKRMLNVQHRLLDLRKQINASGTKVRQALCRTTAIIEPSMLSNYPYTTEMTVELGIPSGFWQDVAESNYVSGIGLVANTNIDLPVFAPATAPMRDIWSVLDGPATNPKMIDNRTGHYIQLNGVVANGSQWVVDTTKWTSKTGVGIAFTNNGTDQYDNTEYAGSHAPVMFGITADPLGPQIRIEGSGFGANTQLRLRGKLKYL